VPVILSIQHIPYGVQTADFWPLYKNDTLPFCDILPVTSVIEDFTGKQVIIIIISIIVIMLKVKLKVCNQ